MPWRAGAQLKGDVYYLAPVKHVKALFSFLKTVEPVALTRKHKQLSKAASTPVLAEHKRGTFWAKPVWDKELSLKQMQLQSDALFELFDAPVGSHIRYGAPSTQPLRTAEAIEEEEEADSDDGIETDSDDDDSDSDSDDDDDSGGDAVVSAASGVEAAAASDVRRPVAPTHGGKGLMYLQNILQQQQAEEGEEVDFE